MAHRMTFYVDGGCRGNGQPGAYGAAAALQEDASGQISRFTRKLEKHENPTNSRAEITAIILALETALDGSDSPAERPFLDVTIHSDSEYGVKCMNEWIHEWRRNGWVSSKGWEVKNRDLIERASSLEDQVKEFGAVTYKYIPREQNRKADKCCNDALDEMEVEMGYVVDFFM
ncbi:ribonuclease H-like protein [Teratosphaeria nubilosa]|uniref:ribonuclease H n=1 Tax=Teratosphaeria nubilosa TaxID=161662 RepID=A0A6G1LNA4_9PEZI|nr:ribonuclease H-like protein [Teratosphaeria nubilosa]